MELKHKEIQEVYYNHMKNKIHQKNMDIIKIINLHYHKILNDLLFVKNYLKQNQNKIHQIQEMNIHLHLQIIFLQIIKDLQRKLICYKHFLNYIFKKNFLLDLKNIYI